MTGLASLTPHALRTLHAEIRAAYVQFQARGLKLDMTRGKPAPDQLDLSNAMLTLPGNGDYLTETGEDARNYGGLQGLPEVRALFAPMLQAPPAQIVVGDNSSLALMHDTLAWAMLKGVPGSAAPWAKAEAPAFLCPVPGYDRHFAICDALGIRMIPVPLTGHGPDMEVVEALARDPAVKGIWCVPKYANPSGDVYSAETIRRLAAMATGAPDFRLYWDNAYAVHHLAGEPAEIPSILDACAEAGNPDRAFVFASTSKITLPGAGLAFFAGSPANVAWFLARATPRTIGPDKLNQLRHLRFFKDFPGILRHMQAHRALLAPKFAAVEQALRARLGTWNVARWSHPAGGYFITVEATPGTAHRVVELAREAGVALTPAGATWPGGEDPNDSALRLAPSYPTLAEVTAASQGVAVCILLAAIEKAL